MDPASLPEDNLLFRLRAREIQRPRPGAAVSSCRELYEYIVPNHTVHDVECPDHSIRKFTSDGQYLICFGRAQQEVIVYRFKGLGGPLPADSKHGELPPNAKSFDAYFTRLYATVLVSNAAEPAQTLCKDFLLLAEGGELLICATSSAPDAHPPAAGGALPGVPAMEVITLHLVRLADGAVVDTRVFRNDYIHLQHNAGVFLYDDLLAVLSVRFQSVHLLQVREKAGRFVDVRTIGPHCREDDELVLQVQRDTEARFQRDRARHRRRSGLAGPSSALEDESDSPSDRIDVDNSRRTESADLEGDSETRSLLGSRRGRRGEVSGGEHESEVASLGGTAVSSCITRGVALRNEDEVEEERPHAFERRERAAFGAGGAAGQSAGVLSVLEERRRSHLTAGPRLLAGAGSFASPFKRLPEGPREVSRMSAAQLAAVNAAAGHGAMHARLEDLRARLQAEQGGNAEVWRGDGLHEDAPEEGTPQGEVSSRPQSGVKREAEKAGISHEWGGVQEYYTQAAKRGKLSADLGVATRLGRREMSDIDDCPSDFAQEGAAEVPGQEAAQVHRFPFGGGLLGGQPECADGEADQGRPSKESGEAGAFPPWGKSSVEPMRLHGGGPANSYTVSYTESEEDGEQMNTVERGRSGVAADFGTGHGLGAAGQAGPESVGRLQFIEQGRGAVPGLHHFQAAAGEAARAADAWEAAHRQLPESGVGAEGSRGLAGVGAWVAPTEEEDPMGRLSAVRPKSRRERMSDWEQAHWQLPDSDSGEERAQRGGRVELGNRSQKSTGLGWRSSGLQHAPEAMPRSSGAGWPDAALYQPFGSGRRGEMGHAHLGGGQGTGPGGTLDRLPNRTGAMVGKVVPDGARIRLAEGLGGELSKGRAAEEEQGFGLEAGIVYNIEEGGGRAPVTQPRSPPLPEGLPGSSEGPAGALGGQQAAAFPLLRNLRQAPLSRAEAPRSGTPPFGSSAAWLHRSAAQGERTPPGEALFPTASLRGAAGGQASWPEQGLRTVHGGVYTSDLIEHLGAAAEEPTEDAATPPARRPLGPEWGAPSGLEEGVPWGPAPPSLLRREGGALWGGLGRTGFAHLHQAVGAARAASRSASSGGDDGEGRPGGRAAGGGLLAAGRIASLYSPYAAQQARSAAPHYEYVVSSRTQSHTSSEPLDDVSMPTATSAPSRQGNPTMRDAHTWEGPARAAPSWPSSATPAGSRGPSLLGGPARSLPGLGSRGRAGLSAAESQPGTSLASGVRASSGRDLQGAPARGRPHAPLGGPVPAPAGRDWAWRPLRERAGSHGEAHSGDGGAAGVASDGEGASEGGAAAGRLLGGLKQRLLSFIFRQAYEEPETSAGGRAARLKRVFYHLQHYEELVMWKVQLLDRHHLLLKFGAADGAVARGSDASTQAAFFAVYNMETTAVLGFFQNTSEAFLAAFERFSDHFRAAPREPAWLRFTSSTANSSHAREALRKQKEAALGAKPGGNAQVVKRALALLPFTCQSLSPSPYLDQSLFHYDEKLISAAERHKPCMEHPIKFISRKRANALRFKIQPGPEGGSGDGRAKRVASYVFHPNLPFVISIQQTYMQPPIVNFHFRWPG